MVGGVKIVGGGIKTGGVGESGATVVVRKQAVGGENGWLVVKMGG